MSLYMFDNVPQTQQDLDFDDDDQPPINEDSGTSTEEASTGGDSVLAATQSDATTSAGSKTNNVGSTRVRNAQVAITLSEWGDINATVTMAIDTDRESTRKIHKQKLTWEKEYFQMTSLLEEKRVVLVEKRLQLAETEAHCRIKCWELKFEPLQSWDQESLVEWLQKGRHYGEEIVERCRISQDGITAVLWSVHSTLSPKMLNYLAHYVFRKPRDSIDDQEIVDKIQERVGEVINGHIPDMFDFFKSRLKMVLDEQDVEDRVVKYFVDFDQLIEEHGFASMLAAGCQGRSDYRDRTKNRCKLIIENLAPAVLKTEIKRLVSLQHREAKPDDIALHQLFLARTKISYSEIRLIALGIDVDRHMEQVAINTSSLYGEDDDELLDNAGADQDNDTEVQATVEQLVANAGANGFSEEHIEALTQIMHGRPDGCKCAEPGSPNPRGQPFSFQTVEGVFTPNRVPQGAMASVMHFRSTMQTAFVDLINAHLFVHIDDVVFYAALHEEYLEVLEGVLW
ncbi:unnamed protein product [Phytophthora fragariaefolia]|uniref:Unnamed protein product n=1 Tax=Phytophthora fragariaefolia TaxID=1490495 RepID=A0A9W6XX31_9STRA|nr:unnamed protein product [Phytophthora fragariaefolia]